MEATYFSETSADFQRTKWHYILGERTLPAFIISYNEVNNVTFISILCNIISGNAVMLKCGVTKLQDINIQHFL
jgi:hypothetical protein